MIDSLDWIEERDMKLWWRNLRGDDWWCVLFLSMEFSFLIDLLEGGIFYVRGVVYICDSDWVGF